MLRKNIAYKCKLFEAVNLTLHGYMYFVCMHMCVQFQFKMYMNCSNIIILTFAKKTNITAKHGILKGSYMSRKNILLTNVKYLRL